MPRYRESPVLAADGRPILIAQEPPYRNAGGGRRFAGFTAPVGLGPNAALLPHLDTLRARSRALYRNSPTVWGAVEKLVGNLVGWGITPQSLHDDEDMREDIGELWADWSRQVKLDKLQKHAARETLLAGEVFLRFRPRLPQDRDALGRRLVVPLELQLIEAEHCPVTENRALPNGGYIRSGIEFDPIGRRVAYWMYPDHPGDGTMLATPRVQELRRVPASEVIHLYDPESPEMIRGVPRLSRLLLTVDKLDSFNDATLERQAIAALFAGFIKRPEGATDPGLLGETAARPEPTLEPGVLSYLAEGEDISFPSAPDVGNNYAPFIKSQLLQLSAGLGMTYESVSNDLSSVNYSSIRAGSLEFRRSCQVWQYTTFCTEFLEPIWVYFLRRAQLTGALDLPDLLTDELAAGRVEWVTQGWDWVDPLKEVQAAVTEVQAGFETREGVNMRRGNDPRRIETKRAAEMARAKQLGLQFSTDVPAPVAATAAPAATTTDSTAADGGEPADDEATPPLRAIPGGRNA
jgi:lambda family phage portal protein